MPLTHLDEEGRPRMVDVSEKEVTVREAWAEGWIQLSAEAAQAVASGRLPKGDVLSVARLAGITAAKRTSDLIPLCHPLPLSGVEVDLELLGDARVRAQARVRCNGRTGVEMEALTCVSAALLTVYDMVKAVDKGPVIGPIRLLEKSGGRSGTWRRSDP